MLSWSKLLVFVPVTIILVVTPGPNTLYIIARGLHGGYRAGLVSCLGILLATLIHIAGAAVGLTALLSSSTLVFNIIKYAGAAYLIWIGLKTLATRKQTESISAMRRQSPGAVFYQAFLVNLLNPKTALFFLAFLPQFVDSSLGRVTPQLILLGMILACFGTTSDCTYALLAGRVGKWLRDNLKLLQLLRFVAGCVYLGLGTATALKTTPH
jgi:threonine/homoserine/homoserine lactone efflux protein